jgi:hypothetical protein
MLTLAVYWTRRLGSAGTAKGECSLITFIIMFMENLQRHTFQIQHIKFGKSLY